MARPSRALVSILNQINAKFPYRDKASDGGIGDAAHASRVSDHNADAAGVYHAYDFDHDPDSNGLNCSILWTQLIASGDLRIKYVIFNGRIWSRQKGNQPYTGPNAHKQHLHLSVYGDSAGDWNLPMLRVTPPSPTPPSSRTYCKYGERNDRVMKLQKHLTSAYKGYNNYTPTGFYGDSTRAGVKEFQSRVGITGADADGSIVGPRTLNELIRRGFKP